MKMYLVGIYDRKALQFISLEPTPNINVSLRQLTENVNTQKDSPLHKWPEDYSFWELGTWDNETGTVWARETDDIERQNKLIAECSALKVQG